MKLSFIFSLILICLTVSICSGQKIHSFLSPIGSLTDVRKGSFSSSEAGFSIDLPKQIGGFSGVTGIEYNWRLTEGYFLAGIIDRNFDVENSTSRESETADVEKLIITDIAREYFETKPEILKVEKKLITVAGHKGHEIRAQLSESTILLRIVWVKERAYKVVALLAGAQQKYESAAQKVIDSLKIFPREDTESLFRKIIEKNTPKPLPQAPVAKRLTSDAQDDHIKGKVKSIVTEIEYIQGPKAGTPKRRDGDASYNENGDFLKRVFYDDTNGQPFEVVVYGYLDGSRVSSYEIVSSESSPPLIAIPAGSVKAVKRDSRFSNKFTYKYDTAGNLVEVTTYDNAGKIWTRRVIKRNGNTIDDTLYDENGKLNSHSVITLDEKGNELKYFSFDAPMKGNSEILDYKYEGFDAIGNWTKRVVTFSRTIQGLNRTDWVSRETRAITYY